MRSNLLILSSICLLYIQAKGQHIDYKNLVHLGLYLDSRQKSEVNISRLICDFGTEHYLGCDSINKLIKNITKTSSYHLNKKQIIDEFRCHLSVYELEFNTTENALNLHRLLRSDRYYKYWGKRYKSIFVYGNTFYIIEVNANMFIRDADELAFYIYYQVLNEKKNE